MSSAPLSTGWPLSHSFTEPQPQVGHCHTNSQNPKYMLATIRLIYRTPSTGWPLSHSFTEPQPQVRHCHTHLQFSVFLLKMQLVSFMYCSCFNFHVGYCQTSLQNPKYRLATVTIIYRTASTGWPPSHSFTEPQPRVGHCHTHLQNPNHGLDTVTLIYRLLYFCNRCYLSVSGIVYVLIFILATVRLIYRTLSIGWPLSNSFTEP